MITQVFYVLTFIGTLLSLVGSSMYLLCYKSDEKYFKRITFALGVTLIVSGKFNITLVFLLPKKLY